MSNSVYSRGNYLRKGKIVVCPICYKKVYRYPSEIKRNYRYCSKKCWYSILPEKARNNPKRLKLLNRIRKLRKPKTDEDNMENSIRVKKLYDIGILRKRFGKDNNLWKGGVSEENNILRHSCKWNRWRYKVFERDNWTCQKCKIKGGKLHPHHIQNFSEYLELRFKVSNGITFCKNCHILFHKIYGKQSNTKEQLSEFIKKVGNKS